MPTPHGRPGLLGRTWRLVRRLLGVVLVGTAVGHAAPPPPPPPPPAQTTEQEAEPEPP
jgi:hypothetical protein